MFGIFRIRRKGFNEKTRFSRFPKFLFFMSSKRMALLPKNFSIHVYKGLLFSYQGYHKFFWSLFFLNLFSVCRVVSVLLCGAFLCQRNKNTWPESQPIGFAKHVIQFFIAKKLLNIFSPKSLTERWKIRISESKKTIRESSFSVYEKRVCSNAMQASQEKVIFFFTYRRQHEEDLPFFGTFSRLCFGWTFIKLFFVSYGQTIE